MKYLLIHLKITIVSPLYVNRNNIFSLKILYFPKQKNNREEWHGLKFCNLNNLYYVVSGKLHCILIKEWEWKGQITC